MMHKQINREDAAEIIKGIALCILLFPVGVIFLVLGTLTGLAELLAKWFDKV